MYVMRSPHLVLASSVLFITVAASCFAQTPSNKIDNALAGVSRSFEQMVARVSPAVVQVLARGLTNRSSGSGVVVDPSGYIVTNAHVVGLSRRIQVLVPVPAEGLATFRSVLKPGGRVLPAQLVGLDRETDIAVLKIESQNLRSLPFGDSEALRQGQLVFAFGSPFGLDNSVSMGVISSPARQVQPDGPMIYIQTDAPINPGNSGGPLVDASGALVGINTFILSASGASAGLGFAAPSNIVQSVYQQIRKDGAVQRGHIGAKVQTITPDLAAALQLKQDWGVIVADVTPGGAAEAAGLEIKDILLTLDGKVLENARQFDVNIYSKAGATVGLDILRGSGKVAKRVAVLQRPADREQLLSKLDGSLIARLGVVAVDLDAKVTPLLPPLRQLSGVVVVGIASQPGGFGDTLLPGDVIYTVNGTRVATVRELESALGSVTAGRSIAVQIERSGHLQFAAIEVQ
jgi:serine protease Do